MKINLEPNSFLFGANLALFIVNLVQGRMRMSFVGLFALIVGVWALKER